MNADALTPPPVERHFRVKRACEIADISRATLFRRIADGSIKVRKLSARMTLVPESELRKLLQADARLDSQPDSHSLAEP